MTSTNITFRERRAEGPTELGEKEIEMYKDGNIAGSLSFSYDEQRHLVIKNVFIYEQYRGQGLAKSFLAPLMQACQQRGLKGIKIGTAIQHPNAARALQSFFPSLTLDEIVAKARTRTLGVITR